MKQLEGLKDKFIEQLEKATIMYKLIGMGDRESPMWLQVKPHEGDANTLLFESSQSNIWMSIPCTAEEKDYALNRYEKTYDYFKYLKYTHLKNNHPTVWNEQSPHWLSNIQNFLDQYSCNQAI